MRLLRKIEAVLSWISALCSLVGAIVVVINKQIDQLPYSIFSVVLFTKWGFDLWKDDTRIIAINGCLMALLYVLVFFGELFACFFIGHFIVGFIAGVLNGWGSSYIPEMLNDIGPWISVALMIICLFKLSPSKVLPKRFFIEKNQCVQNAEECYPLQSNEKKDENKPTLKQFGDSDHSRFMPH